MQYTLFYAWKSGPFRIGIHGCLRFIQQVGIHLTLEQDADAGNSGLPSFWHMIILGLSSWHMTIVSKCPCDPWSGCNLPWTIMVIGRYKYVKAWSAQSRHQACQRLAHLSSTWVQWCPVTCDRLINLNLTHSPPPPSLRKLPLRRTENGGHRA